MRYPSSLSSLYITDNKIISFNEATFSGQTTLGNTSYTTSLWYSSGMVVCGTEVTRMQWKSFVLISWIFEMFLKTLLYLNDIIPTMCPCTFYLEQLQVSKYLISTKYAVVKVRVIILLWGCVELYNITVGVCWVILYYCGGVLSYIILLWWCVILYCCGSVWYNVTVVVLMWYIMLQGWCVILCYCGGVWNNVTVVVCDIILLWWWWYNVTVVVCDIILLWWCVILCYCGSVWYYVTMVVSGIMWCL